LKPLCKKKTPIPVIPLELLQKAITVKTLVNPAVIRYYHGSGWILPELKTDLEIQIESIDEPE